MSLSKPSSKCVDDTANINGKGITVSQLFRRLTGDPVLLETVLEGIVDGVPGWLLVLLSSLPSRHISRAPSHYPSHAPSRCTSRIRCFGSQELTPKPAPLTAPSTSPSTWYSCRGRRLPRRESSTFRREDVQEVFRVKKPGGIAAHRLRASLVSPGGDRKTLHPP